MACAPEPSCTAVLQSTGSGDLAQQGQEGQHVGCMLRWQALTRQPAAPNFSGSYHYSVLRDDKRRCKQCGRRSRLFGDCDLRSGWVGWCEVCNADEWWSGVELQCCRCCSRQCSITSPVLCSLGVEFDTALKINSFLFSDGAFLERVTMRGHRRILQLLEWTCKRMDWYLADDSD